MSGWYKTCIALRKEVKLLACDYNDTLLIILIYFSK